LLCPHLLLCVGRPGEICGGALAQRLRQLWQIILQNVGDDPAADPHQVYGQTWRSLLQRYAAEGDLMIEGNCATALFVEKAAEMADIVERCIPGDEL
jgi:hypothetical protein